MQRLAADGSLVGSDVQITTGMAGAYEASAVWTGSEYAVAWQDRRDAGNFEIYLARVAPDGTVIGPDVRVTSSAGSTEEPRISWSGTDIAIVWQDDGSGTYQIGVARVSGDGVVLGLLEMVSGTTDQGRYPTLAWGGSVLGVTWHRIVATPTIDYFVDVDVMEFCE
jgi:hypothetical protein